MEWLTETNWKALFAFETSFLEVLIRGTVGYLALFFLMRLILKRSAGGLGVADLLMVVLIGEAIANALAGDYRSLPEGVLLVAVIIFWAWFLNWATFHFPSFQRFVQPSPLPLVRNGVILRHNMARELVTVDELRSQLRSQNVDDLSRVKTACMEPDGRISVICLDPSEESAGPSERPS